MGINRVIEQIDELRSEVASEVNELNDLQLSNELARAITELDIDPYATTPFDQPSLPDAFRFMLANGDDLDPRNVEELSANTKAFLRRQELVREFSGRLATKVTNQGHRRG